MERKETLRAVVACGKRMGDELAGRLGESERAAAGTLERWAPKDVFGHVAEWLARDVRRLSIPDDPLPVYEGANIEVENRAIFERFASENWEEVIAFFHRTYDETQALIARLSAVQIDRTRAYADGSAREVWRTIAGHALMHAAPHFAVVYERRGEPELATAMEETAAAELLPLDNSPQWIGTLKYNLACHFAVNGRAKHAIELLRVALRHNSELVERSREDTDLDPIRSDPEFPTVYPETE